MIESPAPTWMLVVAAICDLMCCSSTGARQELLSRSYATFGEEDDGGVDAY